MLSQKLSFTYLVLLAALLPSLCSAQTIYNYMLSIENKQVGKISISKQTSNTDGGYTLTQSFALKVDSFWEKININSYLIEKYNAQGQLQSADNKLTQNDRTYWTKTERHKNEFFAQKSELTNDQQKREDESDELVSSAIVNFVPGAGDLIMIGKVLLPSDQPQSSNNRFNASSFDSSFMNLPYFWQRSGNKFPAKLKIFDTEALYIIAGNITDFGEVKIIISGTPRKAHHYRINLKDEAPLDIWLAENSQGIAHFVQITGEDGAPYKITLVNSSAE